MQDQPVSRRMLAIIFIVVILAAAGILLTRYRALASPRQPVNFSHNTHSSEGIQCLYCHTTAMRAEIASIPSVEKCMGCHAIIASDSREIKKVASYWEQGEPIPWVSVNNQPDFVYFSHQPHLGAGLNCEACHGNVSGMRTIQPVYRMDMGWCLKCHLEQQEDQIPRLADCMACHK